MHINDSWCIQMSIRLIFLKSTKNIKFKWKKNLSRFIKVYKFWKLMGIVEYTKLEECPSESHLWLGRAEHSIVQQNWTLDPSQLTTIVIYFVWHLINLKVIVIRTKLDCNALQFKINWVALWKGWYVLFFCSDLFELFFIESTQSVWW